MQWQPFFWYLVRNGNTHSLKTGSPATAMQPFADTLKLLPFVPFTGIARLTWSVNDLDRGYGQCSRKLPGLFVMQLFFHS